MKVFADQIGVFVRGRRFVALGTDGYGRSDTREALRSFFEVDRRYIVIAALKALADEDALPQSTVTEAIRKFGMDSEKQNPANV
jgi:pyruvate dehydrogenase E1 component